MLSRTLRASLVLLLASTLALTGTSVATAARPDPSSAPESARSSVAVGVDTLDLHGDGVGPHRNGRTARVQTWKVRTLYYYETLPAKWDWSLSTAVAKWNGSGARIRLVRTTIPRKAHVRIGYANIGSAAGLATVGATRNAFLHLSSRFRGWDAVNALNRVTIMNVLAHELGHVFGFQHTAARCSLMAPVIDVDACGALPSSQPGYYKCRTLDNALVARFIKVYGGRALYAWAGSCLIEPLPPVLDGVTFTGGLAQGGRVAIHWRRPTAVPAGSRIVIRRWVAGSCSTVPAWADTIIPSLSTTSWQDGIVSSRQTACFRIQLVNRYGAGWTAATTSRVRWVPLQNAPTIGAPTYDSGRHRFRFPVTRVDGHLLVAMWDDEAPSTCVTNFDLAHAQEVDVDHGHGLLDDADLATRCVSFFDYDPALGRVSAPTSVSFTTPEPEAPDSPEIGAATWSAADHTFRAPVSYPAGTRLEYALSDDPDVCPGDYTVGEAVTEDVDRLGQGIGEFSSPHPHACVSFYAIDEATDKVSAPTSITVDAPLPTENLNVGSLHTYGSAPSSALYAFATGLAPGHRMGTTYLRGPCPAEAPADIHWMIFNPALPISSLPDEYPTFSSGVGTTCALFAPFDWFAYTDYRNDNRHGPVVMREWNEAGVPPPVIDSTQWDQQNHWFRVQFAQSEPAARKIVVQANPSDPSTCPTRFDRNRPYWSGSAGSQVAIERIASTFCVASFYYDDNNGWATSTPTITTLTVP